MQFTQPVWLMALLLIALLGLVSGYVFWALRRPVNTVVLKQGAPTNLIAQKRISKHLVFIGIVGSLLVSGFIAGQPAWTGETAENRNTVMIVLDVSTSMDATDVSPSRLEAAKAAIAAAVKNAPSSLNIGLVTLADHAQSVATPSLDHSVLLDKLATLKSQPGGTASGEGVLKAIDSLNYVRTFGGEATSFNGRIILVSDGVEEISSGEQNLQAATAKSKKLAYAIDTVSYGTPNGTLNGQPIQVDPDSLVAASAATGGLAISAESGQKLQAALDTIQNSASSAQRLQAIPAPWAWTALAVFLFLWVVAFYHFVMKRR